MSGEAHETVAAAMEAVGSAQDENNDKIVAKEFPPQDVESLILGAMRSRVSYLREKADSFTFESVRRLLEEDLGFEKYALDAHKSFVKQHLIQCLDGAGNGNASENAKETEREDVTVDKEAAGSQSPKRRKSNKDVTENSPKDEDKLEESPVMGLLKGEKQIDSGAKETKDQAKKEVSETEIKKALMKRASYIKANSEKVTMALLRRLLEEDLELEKHSLDIHKKFINEQLDEVLEAYEATKQATTAKGKNLKKKSDKKATKKLSSEESSDSFDSEADGEEEEKNDKKKTAQKRKLQKSAAPKKRKHVEETRVSAKKRTKPAETNSQSESDKAESDTASDDGQTAEKPVTKKGTAAPAYGKRVEHLKSVIKSCGMSIGPTVYRKVKQGPEDLREANLIKELEQILAKEGLSSNPSEKEIKEVKKRKERAKELEGIDMSNIVSSTRRRSTSLSFAPPLKPKVPDESKSDESEDSENDDDNDDGDDGDDDDGEEQQEEEDGDNEEGDEESASESEEDVEEESE